MSELTQDLSSLSHDLASRIHCELEPGENLLWVGQPSTYRVVFQALPGLLIGIPWTAFSSIFPVVLWDARNQANAMSIYLVVCISLFLMLFLGVGFAMMASPFWAWYAARRTCYAVTEWRVIGWEPAVFRGMRVWSYTPDDVVVISRMDGWFGRGDVIIDEFGTCGSKGRIQTHQRGFFGIENPREVERMIRQVLSRE